MEDFSIIQTYYSIQWKYRLSIDDGVSNRQHWSKELQYKYAVHIILDVKKKIQKLLTVNIDVKMLYAPPPPPKKKDHTNGWADVRNDKIYAFPDKFSMNIQQFSNIRNDFPCESYLLLYFQHLNVSTVTGCQTK